MSESNLIVGNSQQWMEAQIIARNCCDGRNLPLLFTKHRFEHRQENSIAIKKSISSVDDLCWKFFSSFEVFRSAEFKMEVVDDHAKRNVCGRRHETAKNFTP